MLKSKMRPVRHGREGGQCAGHAAAGATAGSTTSSVAAAVLSALPGFDVLSTQPSAPVQAVQPTVAQGKALEPSVVGSSGPVLASPAARFFTLSSPVTARDLDQVFGTMQMF